MLQLSKLLECTECTRVRQHPAGYVIIMSEGQK